MQRQRLCSAVIVSASHLFCSQFKNSARIQILLPIQKSLPVQCLFAESSGDLVLLVCELGKRGLFSVLQLVSKQRHSSRLYCIPHGI